MKILINKLICVLFFVFSFSNYSISQPIGQGELLIVNHTSVGVARAIMVKIYPVGAIFSGAGQYTVDATYAINPTNKFIF